MRQVVTLVIAVASVAACTRENGLRGDSIPANTLAPSATAVAQLDSLLADLPNIGAALTDDWQFAERPRVFARLAGLSDSSRTLADTAVARLVACLDRAEPVSTVYQGRSVSLGIICYAALRQVGVYHEEIDARGDIEPDWPGNLANPSATPEQLRAAKVAWLSVLAARTYQFT